MKRRERFLWYLLIAIVSASVLLCLQLISGDSRVHLTEELARACALICFPVCLMLIGQLRPELIKEKSLSFVVYPFFLYQIFVFAILLLVFHGIEPFILMGVSGAHIGLSMLSFVDQGIVVAASIAAVAIFNRVEKLPFLPSGGKIKFSLLCIGLFAFGVIATFSLEFMSYTRISDFFGSYFEERIGTELAYPGAKYRFATTSPDAEDYGKVAASLVYETSRLDGYSSQRLKEAKQIAVRALGLCKTGKQKLDIYRGLTNLNIDKANNLEYFEAQLPLYESLGDEDLYARSSCCMNIGFLLIKSDVARAVKMFDQGEALCAKSGVSPELFLMESGCALQRAKQYSLAEKYFRKIVKMPEYRDNKRIRDSVDMRLEQCLLEQKKLKNSKSVAK